MKYRYLFALLLINITHAAQQKMPSAQKLYGSLKRNALYKHFADITHIDQQLADKELSTSEIEKIVETCVNQYTHSIQNPILKKNIQKSESRIKTILKKQHKQ